MGVRSRKMKGTLSLDPSGDVVVLKTGKTEIQMTTEMKVTNRPSATEAPPGGLYPMQTKAWEMDEYRMLQGWPVAVPGHDIRCNTMLSAVGEVFGVRDDNTAIETGALIRWVADENFFSEEALKWYSIQDGTGGQSAWESSVEALPVLIDDYEYRVDNERFIESTLNFDSDTQNHLWCDFTSTIGGSSGYTVIMVMSPNSVYGNNADVPFHGLWCPGGPTGVGDTFDEPLEGDWVSITLQGDYLYYETNTIARMRAISIAQQLTSNAPMYLAFCIGPIESVFYVGFGSESIRNVRLHSSPNLTALHNSVLIGRSNGDILHCADMALFDVGIYGDKLNNAQVANEFAILSRAYGGSQ